ncbi:MAG: fimbrillin family protein [Bacteroidales bacterium]
MNHQHYLYTLLCGALLASTSCSHNIEVDANVPNGRIALEVTSGINTRAYDATWEAGDAMGIYMFNNNSTTISEGAENRNYTTTGDGKFSPVTTPANQTIYFPITGKTDFMAYYPWQSITKDASNKYLYAVNVASQTSQKAIDLMAAAKVVGKDKEHKEVAFEFTHKLAKIALTEIKHGDGLMSTDLQGLSVKLTNQRTKATYNVVDGGEVVVNTAEPASEVALLVANSNLAEAIVLPAASTAGMKLVFTLKNGDVYSWALSNAAQSSAFAAGKKYSYKITISKEELSVTSTITNWVSGNGTGDTGTAQ